MRKVAPAKVQPAKPMKLPSVGPAMPKGPMPMKPPSVKPAGPAKPFIPYKKPAPSKGY